ncbi:hypothetical protein TRIATDRAFT_305383 [Trichoderma atroviride IMI 206040]|uniref:Uncharacterized protein n=1 Tax=Hypocrea atroviridis (strain ATCC 20476 / IMI 206040) TaxID=452589 RepID=G9NL07_HYPAI|nr:uncharacterized protein TRIATDRAFT_305383 [Trichoderma atroviride IMI 206040]EHK48575.1 hypothetical protein TRIATDRAFT_305383 [Trichoderma atroviride IMI 206040]
MLLSSVQSILNVNSRPQMVQWVETIERLKSYGDVSISGQQMLELCRSKGVSRCAISCRRKDQKQANSASNEEEISETSPGLPAIKTALYHLLELSEEIRRSTRHNDHNELFYIALVQRRFPFAREGLCRQLGASIHERGISLQYLQEYNKELAYRHNGKDNLKTIEEMPEEQINAAAVSSINKDMAPKEEMVAQEPETRHPTVASSAMGRIKRDTTYPPSTITTRGSIIRDIQQVKYDFPHKPRQENVETHQSCTICAMPLNLPTLTDRTWEAHVDQDLEPYMDHMKIQHSIDWSKQVHTDRWDKLSQSRIMGRGKSSNCGDLVKESTLDWTSLEAAFDFRVAIPNDKLPESHHDPSYSLSEKALEWEFWHPLSLNRKQIGPS